MEDRQNRQREAGSGGGRGPPGGGRGRRGDPLGRPADAAVLRGAAAALNEFSNDGSFLDSFKGAADSAKAGVHLHTFAYKPSLPQEPLIAKY